MWIFLLVNYSEVPHFYYDTMEAISTNAPLLRQWKKNNKKRIINDIICASSISPAWSSMDNPYFCKQGAWFHKWVLKVCTCQKQSELVWESGVFSSGIKMEKYRINWGVCECIRGSWRSWEMPIYLGFCKCYLHFEWVLTILVQSTFGQIIMLL